MNIFFRKREFLLLVSLFIIIALSIVIIATNKEKKIILSKAQETISPAPEASPSAQIALLETMIESKNIETDNLLNKYEKTTDEEEQQNIVSSLENNLTERKNNLLSLLKLSPLSVYKKAFDKDKIEKLQKVGKIKDKKLTEEHVDEIKGTVNTTIYDNFDDNISYTTATFIPDDNEEEINFYPTDNQTFLSGTKVTLNDAVRIDKDNNNQVLGVSSVYAQEQQPQEKETPQSHLIAVDIETIETPPLDTLGEQKILVLLACLENLNCDQLPQPNEIKQRINNNINQFFERDSYNHMSLIAHTTNRWLRIKKEETYEQNRDKIIFQRSKKILSEFADEIDFTIYNRLGIISVTTDSKDKKEDGQSSLGISRKIKIADRTTNEFSLLTIDASSQSDYFFTSIYHQEKEKMSIFDSVVSHELIHSFGGHHATSTNTTGNTFVSMDNIRRNGIAEYGNEHEIMGRPYYGVYSNAYIKKEFKWIGENTGASILKININKPEGTYTLKKMGSTGQIAMWLPYSSLYKDIDNDISQVDQFFEFRTQLPGLIINLLEKPVSSSHALMRTILFPATRSSNVFPFSSTTYKENEIFFDKVHKIKIKVKDIDDNTDTLTFTISSCDKIPFKAIPYRAGNNQFIPSLNIFENDLRGENNTNKPFTIKENFLIENTSLCFNKKYIIDQSAIIVNRGNLYISAPQFSLLSTEAIPPSRIADNSFTTIATVNNPALPDSQLEFQVVEQTLRFGGQNLDKDKQEQPISKKLIYQFHVVPSTEEYRNDLEPFIIEIKDKNINNKDFNHLETEKGQTLVFTSNIANNSRRAENENPSPKFRMIWYIQNDTGGNVIPPFNQPHDGIPPKTLDDANPAILTWTIPQDMKAGDYKIILEVDSNNRLQEFNENNNMMYRYFSVVE